MALNADTVWELRQDGDDNNGGGYYDQLGGNDYSQQAAAQVSGTDGATSGVGVTSFTSASGGFTGMADNIIHIYDGGSAVNLTEGWYQIMSVTNDTTIVLDRAPDDGVGAVSNATFKVGGALKSLGGLGYALSTGNGYTDGQGAFIKYSASDYTNTSASDNVAGGILNFNAASITGDFWIIGYDTTRSSACADANRPRFDAGSYGASNVSFIELNVAWNKMQVVANFIFDSNSRAVRAISGDSQSNCRAYRCDSVDSAADEAFYSIGGFACYADTPTGVGFQQCRCYFCWSDNSGGTGFDQGYGASENVYCISSNSGGSGFDMGRGAYCLGCIAYNSTGDNFESDFGGVLINCVSVDAGAYDLDAEANAVAVNFATYNATGGKYPAGKEPVLDAGHINLSADPFNDSASDDYSLHATNGADLFEAGIGVVGQTDYRDIGALVRQVTGGGGGGAVFGGGILGA